MFRGHKHQTAVTGIRLKTREIAKNRAQSRFDFMRTVKAVNR